MGQVADDVDVVMPRDREVGLDHDPSRTVEWCVQTPDQGRGGDARRELTTEVAGCG
jgi:hypothetical protein